MSAPASTLAPPAAPGPRPAPWDPWDGLRALQRGRLVVAVLALPVGVLLRPEAESSAVGELIAALVAVALVSLASGLGIRLRRAVTLQTYLNLAADVALVAALSAVTGGRASQFVLFFALVVITGGLLLRVPGGLAAAAGASLAFMALPALGAALTGRPDPALGVSFQRPELILAFLAMTGVLSGILGDRVGRTREDLERTTRALDRERVDNDAVLRSLMSGVVTVDGEGRISYVNPAAEQMLSLKAMDVLGRTLDQALTERLGPLRAVLEESLARGTGRARVELNLRRPSGRALPVGLSVNPLVHDGAVQGVAAVFQDLTEVREMERRARRQEALAEVGALAAGIAHELRNGLNPISGSAECLQRELRLEGENAVLLELIVRECSRLNRFVTDLLNYSRERELAVTPLDLDAQLASVREGLLRDPRRAEAVRLDWQPHGAAPQVPADGDLLRQVWINLGVNALEAMPQGGTLTVRCRPGRGSELVVEFADTGHGIAAADLSRVGQPFFTTKKGGTGLGLAIAQRIVERHGGTLVIESETGRGTTARVTLPALPHDTLAHAA